MTGEVLLDGRVTLYVGDCRDVVATLADASIDAVVTDPPYALVSIGKRFGKPGAAAAKDYTGERPGATGAYARASAGFMGQRWDTGEVAFDPAFWSEVLRVLKPGGHVIAFGGTRTVHRLTCAIEDAGFEIRDMLAWIYGTGFPKSHNLVEEWEGWGSALKPALEPLVLARRPFRGSLAANVLTHGTGALNIDGCRVGSESTRRAKLGGRSAFPHEDDAWEPRAVMVGSDVGRWPANVVHDGSDEVASAFPSAVGAQGVVTGEEPASSTGTVYSRYADRASSTPRGDSGSAARFFFSAKADADDRLGSKHPTVKPVALMQWLVRLVTPPRVLDCPQCDILAYGKSTEKTSTDSPLRMVQDTVQAEGQSARGQVLQPTMRGGRRGSSEEDLRVVRGDIPAEEGRGSQVLQPDLCEPGDVGDKSLDEGVRPQQGRLQTALDAGPSAVPCAEGIHLRASLGDAAEDRQAADESGSGSPHQRHQDGQPAGEPSVDAEGRPRQAEFASAEHPVLPPLPGQDCHQPACARCGHRLEYRPGRVLDPFAGSGTTGEAAWREGCRAILVEREAAYADDIRRRMRLAMAGPDTRAREVLKARGKTNRDAGPLFADFGFGGAE